MPPNAIDFRTLAAPLVQVVDDEPDVREMVTEFLTDLGFRVESAQTGAEAVVKVATLHPDLVVMDVRLPDMDGIDVICRIRTLDIPQPRFVVGRRRYSAMSALGPAPPTWICSSRSRAT